MGEFDPNIFPIPSWVLNSQALPIDNHTVICPGPKPQDPPLASPTSTEAKIAGTASAQLSESEPTTADKDFFMALTCLAARRSKDPHRQVRIFMQRNTIQ